MAEVIGCIGVANAVMLVHDWVPFATVIVCDAAVVRVTFESVTRVELVSV